MLDRNGIPPSWKLLQQLQEIGFFLGGVGWVKGGGRLVVVGVSHVSPPKETVFLKM